jgi:hypothetical protein
VSLYGFCVATQSGESFQQAHARQVGVYGQPSVVRWFDSGSASAGAWNPGNANLRWLLAQPAAVFPTFKCDPELISNGSQDAKLRTHIGQLRAGRDVFGYWHEREDEVLAGTYSVADFQRADARIRAIIDATNPGLDFGAVVMEYSMRPERGPTRPLSDYFVPGVHTSLWFDVYSGYAEGSGYVLDPQTQFGKLAALALKHGVQWGIGELGSGVRPAGRPEFPTRAQWLETRTGWLLSCARPPRWVCYFAKGGSVLDGDPAAAAVMQKVA